MLQAIERLTARLRNWLPARPPGGRHSAAHLVRRAAPRAVAPPPVAEPAEPAEPFIVRPYVLAHEERVRERVRERLRERRRGRTSLPARAGGYRQPRAGGYRQAAVEVAR